MNAESVSRVAFRLTREEIAALLQLMAAKQLQGTDIKAEMPTDKTVLSLIESGVVMPCGEQTFVDRVISRILREMLESQRCLIARTSNHKAMLYKGTTFYVLMEQATFGSITIEPLKDAEAVKSPWQQSIDEMGTNIETMLVQHNEVICYEQGSQASGKMLSKFIER